MTDISLETALEAALDMLTPVSVPTPWPELA